MARNRRVIHSAGKSAPNRLSSVSYEVLRRATPAETLVLTHGKSSKARRYVKASTKRVTAKTPSVSARAYENKRNVSLHGVKAAEATELRKTGEIGYRDQSTAARTVKAQETRLFHNADKRIGEYIPSSNPKRKGRRGRGQYLNRDALDRYREYRERKLNGEELSQGQWAEMVDIGAALKDPKLRQLRKSASSPDVGAFTIGI